MNTVDDIVTVVVDDPTGCVVPSPGVHIIGKGARISFMPRGDNRYYDLGTIASFDIKERLVPEPVKYRLEPSARAQLKAFRAKPKRLHKGLRP